MTRWHASWWYGGVGDEKDDKNERIDEVKIEGETTDSVSTTVNNEKFGGNVDLDGFYDIYDKEDKNITDYSIVWVILIKPFGK